MAKPRFSPHDGHLTPNIINRLKEKNARKPGIARARNQGDNAAVPHIPATKHNNAMNMPHASRR